MKNEINNQDTNEEISKYENQKITHIQNTEKELEDSVERQRKIVIKELNDAVSKNIELKGEKLIFSQIKYIKLNMDDVAELNGYIKFNYSINKKHELILLDVDYYNETNVAGINNNMVINTIDEVLDQVREHFSENRKHVYRDSKKDFSKDFENFLREKYNGIIEMYEGTDFDTILIHKFGNVVSVEGFSVESSDNLKEVKVLQSKIISEEQPKQWYDFSEFLENKPLKNIDYEMLAKAYKIIQEV